MQTGRWRHTPLIAALAKQRQADLCEFEASLVYRTRSRTARAVIPRNLVSKNKTKQQSKCKLGVVVRAFYSSILETETTAGGSL